MTNLYNTFKDATEIFVPVGSRKKPTKVKVGFVNISDLKLDPNNQRLKNDSKLKNKTAVDEEFILQRLIDTSNVETLAKSMHSNGPGSNPILVRSDGTVMEGNRRLAAHRLNAKNSRFKSILAYVFPPNLDEDIGLEVFKLHVAGPLTWSPMNKGEALCDRIKSGKLTVEGATVLMGKPKKEINYIIEANKTIEAFEATTGTKGRKRLYSHFIRFVKVKDKIAKTLGGKVATQSWFFRMEDQGLISDCQHVDKLPLIVEDKEARQILEKDGSEAALSFLGTTQDGIHKGLHTQDPMVKILSSTYHRITVAKPDKFQTKNRLGKKRIELLNQLLEACKEKLEQIGMKEPVRIKV